MDHSFDVEDAINYGVEAAVILKNIRHWTKKNEANEKHYHDGLYWTYNSVKAFEKQFPYLTYKQISTRLKKLIDAGVLLEGNFNSHAYDKTKWYAVQPSDSLNFPNGKMEFPKWENGISQTGTPIPYNKPNSKPDSKLLPETKVSSEQITKKIIEVYYEWFKSINDGIPPEINNAQGAGAKKLGKYLLQIVKEKNPEVQECEILDKIKGILDYIFGNWGKLDKFNQKQVKLTQINSNITNIINDLKNSANVTSSSGRKTFEERANVHGAALEESLRRIKQEENQN